MRQKKDKRLKTACGGFTVIEILIVVVILAIAAVIAVPMMSSAASFQIRSAANMIAADLEYAKSMAISRQRSYAVVFDEAAESYQIEDVNGVIGHPVRKGFPYIISFSNDGRLETVDITEANFNSASRIEFDTLGSPDNGGFVDLQADQMTMQISVSAVTGYITITQ